jgi:hypothetical protein
MCILTNNHETFCGKDCESNDDCPQDHTCKELRIDRRPVKQCIPMDESCYY